MVGRCVSFQGSFLAGVMLVSGSVIEKFDLFCHEEYPLDWMGQLFLLPAHPLVRAQHKNRNEVHKNYER